MHHALRGLALLALPALLASAGDAKASTLTVDAQGSVVKKLGDTLHVVVSGAKPSSPAWLLVDLNGGPKTVFGQPVALGFTPALLVIPIGSTSAGGTLAVNFTLPILPALDDKAFFLVSAVADNTKPGGVDFSGGSKVLLTATGWVSTDLAGNPLASYPFFQNVRAFNGNAAIAVAVDPSRFPMIVGKNANLFVVAKKTKAQWDADQTLIDVTPAVENATFTAASIQADTFTVDTGTLPSLIGTTLGVGYDVVIDVDKNGLLSPGDFIDGYGAEAGLYAVHDTTLAGPFTVVELTYSLGTLKGQNTFYPANIASLGKRPLVVVSHGNGHNYQWYDHIGNHLASYGYVVMSHENNTVPGSDAASLTTLDNTDAFLANLASIGGGAMNGHIDSHRIIWIGHSRGGEGVARAVDRLFDGTNVMTNYTLADIKLVSSIAPTDFLGTASSNPHDVPYHLWVGEADNDVSGCSSQDLLQSYHLLGRALNARQSIALHGVGHGDFHNGGGSSVAAGPCLVGRPTTHTIMRGYLLPLVERTFEGDVPATDFLWRQWEAFHPIGAPFANACVNVDLTYTEPVEPGKFVIDDFQTNPATNLASSGAAVIATVQSLAEGRLDDNSSDFTANAGDVFNGFTQASASDFTRGAVFQFDGSAAMSLAFAIPAANRNFTGFKDLSFRCCQATRHAFTIAALGDLTFDVRLTDGYGRSSTINIGAYGGGIEEPYQRTTCGVGAGWGNEFETVRIRLTDFDNNGTGVDLSNVATVEMVFGPGHGSPQGRLGLDDVEITKD